MSSKIATYITLTLMMALGISYGLTAMSFKKSAFSSTIGSGYFPGLLAIILIVLCIVSFVQTVLKKEDERIELPKFNLVVTTVVITSLFIFSWNVFGYLYINLFIFLLVLFTIYRLKELNKAVWFKHSLLSLVITGSLFIIFDLLLNINM